MESNATTFTRRTHARTQGAPAPDEIDRGERGALTQGPIDGVQRSRRSSARAALALSVSCIVAFAALAASAIAQSSPPSAPKADEPPALVIDGERVPAALYAEWLLRLQGEAFAREYATDHFLVARAAENAGVACEPREVDAAVQKEIDERVRGAFHGETREWLAELARTGRTEAGVRRQRSLENVDRLNARALAAIDRVVPRAKIEREWWTKYGRRGRRYDLRLLKVGVEVESRPEQDRAQWEREAAERRATALEKARGLRARIAGGADFGQVAQENSTDAETRSHRGVPAGGAFRDEGWPNAFLDELGKLKPGELSQPLWARGGWWLVEVRAVKETPLADVEGELAAELLARGPEDDEVAMVKSRLADGVRIDLLPSLLDPTPDPELHGPQSPVIAIDGESVTRAEYARWLMGSIGETYARHFVEEWLMRRKAAQLGVTVDEAEVRQRAIQFVADIIDTNFGRSRDRWYDDLARTGRTEADFLRDVERRLRSDLLAEKLIVRERKVTPEEIRARFESAYGKDGVRKEVARILISTRYEELDRTQGAEALAKAQVIAFEKAHQRALEIVRRARGGEDFAELARRESDDLRTRDDGGRIPGRFRKDTLYASVADGVDALKEGEVGEPHALGPTWAVYKMLSVRRVTFDEVRDEIERELREEPPRVFEVRVYRNTLAQGAKWSIEPGMAR